MGAAVGRPRTPVGAYGDINIRQIDKNTWEARGRFRGADGKLEPRRRRGSTKKAAENRLKDLFSKMAQELFDDDINRNTKMSVLAKKFLEEVELEVELGARSHNSIKNYRSIINAHLEPALGELAAYEVTVSRCDAFLKAKRKTMKYNSLVAIRSCLKNLCAFAVRNRAMGSNPVPDLARIIKADDDVKPVRAMNATDRDVVFGKVEEDEWAQDRDLPGLMEGLLATAVRISELAACVGDDFVIGDDDELVADRFLAAGQELPETGIPVLRVCHRIIRKTGEGLVRVKRKDSSTKGGPQRLIIPTWAVPMFIERKLASGGQGPLFPNVFNGGWIDPSEAQRRLKRVLPEEYSWATSHVIGRKTVATTMHRAGTAQEVIQAQTGHRTFKTTEDHYLEPLASNAAALTVLESLAPRRARKSGA